MFKKNKNGMDNSFNHNDITEDIEIIDDNAPLPNRDEIKKSVSDSQKIIKMAATGAAGVGAIPIPFTDAALLVPIQTAMLYQISEKMGRHVNKNEIQKLAQFVVTAGGTTIIGRTLVGGFFKLIPGVGSVVGGTICATVAGGITYATGEIYLNVLKNFANNGKDINSIPFLDILCMVEGTIKTGKFAELAKSFKKDKS